jgi:hypothetical protein
METLKFIWKLLGIIIITALYIVICYDYFINHREPGNFTVYLSLMLYMQIILKHK